MSYTCILCIEQQGVSCRRAKKAFATLLCGLYFWALLDKS